MKLAYLHAFDSKMRGRYEQSLLSFAPFWPSLQQSSIEISSAPMDIKEREKNEVCFFLHICEHICSQFIYCALSEA